jgi:hypothetical protein
MSASPCRIGTSTVQQPNPFTTIKSINRSELTKGAKILYSQLRVSAGPKGFVYYRVHRLAEDTNSSISSTKEYLQELRTVGLVIPEYRPGHSNKWYVYDPDPTWDGKVPESPTQPVDRPGSSRWSDGGSAGPPATLKNVLQDVRTQNVKNVRGAEDIEVRVPDHEVWDEANDENVDKSWPSDKIQDPETNEEVRVPPEDADTYAYPPATTEVKNDFQEPSDHLQTPQPAEPESTMDRVTPSVPDDQQSPGSPVAPGPKEAERNTIPENGQNRTRNVPSRHREKIFDTTLLAEILEMTGDYKSRGCWISVIRQVDEDSIRYGLSCLRQAEVDGTMIERPGAYLLSVLREHNEIRFGSKTRKSGNGVSPSTRNPDRVPSTAYSGDQVPTTPPRPTVFTPSAPPEPDPPQPSIEELVKGWRFAAGTIGVPRVLEIMKTTIGDSLDPSTLWSQVKELCTGLDERTLLDRFLQVVTTRLRHFEAQKKE